MAKQQIKTKDLKQGAMLMATPHEVYEMLMDSKRHSTFTGETARISRKVGGKFSCYGGWIEGKNVKLTKDKEIVQQWRGKNWPKGHYSKVTFSLKKAGKGTKLMFSQKGIPSAKLKGISSGWKEFYWAPMKSMINS